MKLVSNKHTSINNSSNQSQAFSTTKHVFMINTSLPNSPTVYNSFFWLPCLLALSPPRCLSFLESTLRGILPLFINSSTRLVHLKLWHWKSIGSKILLMFKYIPVLVKIYWRRVIREFYKEYTFQNFSPTVTLTFDLEINMVHDFDIGQWCTWFVSNPAKDVECSVHKNVTAER